MLLGRFFNQGIQLIDLLMSCILWGTDRRENIVLPESSKPEPEGEIDILFRGNPIRFLHIGSPAVNAADAPHGAAERHHRSAWNGQLIGVEGLDQLLRGIGNGRKGKGLLVLLDRQSVI